MFGNDFSGFPWWTHHLGAGDPAVAVNRVVTHHFEVLSAMRGGSIGIGFLESVHHADALDGLLLNAVHVLGLLNVCGLKDRRDDVDHVVELVANSAGIINVPRPGNRHALTNATEVRGNLLSPREWSVKRPSPGYRHVVVSFVRTPDVIEIFQLSFDGNLNLVEHGDFIGSAD